MRIKYLIKYLAVVALLISFTSCEEFLGDINKDPNKPAAVPISGRLAQMQIQMADGYGGTVSRFNGMYVQHVEGVDRQWVAFNQYNSLPEDFDGLWNDMYENIVVELKPLIELAEAEGHNHYLAIFKVIEANVMMILTDHFGDVPYTEAGLGASGITKPVYDDQATVIYPAILNLLNEATTLLNGASGDLVPGSDDVYYSGNKDSWLRAIEAIKARYYLRLKNYDQALIAAQASFTEASHNLAYTYSAPPNGSPWYRFNAGRTGDIEFHPTMRGIMTGLNDNDRLEKLDQTFITTHPYLISAYRLDLISYREIQFIIAECLQRTGGDATQLNTAYLAGISASFAELGLTSDNYNSYVSQASVSPGIGSVTLEHILTQKYLALFVQPEAYSDWRRTGIPTLSAVSGSQGIPVRYPYPLNEDLYNSNLPEVSSNLIFEPVDWDN